MKQDGTKHGHLDALIAALKRPLSPVDLSGGWTDDLRIGALRIAERTAEQANSAEPGSAAFHFVRWLDHEGIISGPLLELVAKAQNEMPVHNKASEDIGAGAPNPQR